MRASRKAEKPRTDSERLSRLMLRCAMPASRKIIICFISLIVALLSPAAGISMREPREDGSIVVQVNETWASVAGEELGRRLVAALD